MRAHNELVFQRLYCHPQCCGGGEGERSCCHQLFKMLVVVAIQVRYTHHTLASTRCTLASHQPRSCSGPCWWCRSHRWAELGLSQRRTLPWGPGAFRAAPHQRGCLGLLLAQVQKGPASFLHQGLQRLCAFRVVPITGNEKKIQPVDDKTLHLAVALLFSFWFVWASTGPICDLKAR